MSTVEWTLVFTGLGAVAAFIAAVGVWWAARTFKFNTWLKAQEIYTDDKFTESRETILSGYPVVLQNPSEDDKKHALRVCRKMDELAHLKWYVGKKKIIESWGHQMGKSWIILEKFVSDVRTQDGYLKKWKAFEYLAEEAITKYDLRKLSITLWQSKRDMLRITHELLQIKRDMSQMKRGLW